MAGAQAAQAAAAQAGMTSTYAATQTGLGGDVRRQRGSAGRNLPRHGHRQGLTAGPALPGAVVWLCAAPV
ncbi:hypothetical protein ABID95_007440 [Streptomyces atratus]